MHDVTIKKKAMISMNGLTDEEIEKIRNKVIRHLERLGYKVVINGSPTIGTANHP